MVRRFIRRKDTEFHQQHQIIEAISSIMDEKSKPTIHRGLAFKYLIEKSTFFNFGVTFGRKP